MMDIVERLSGQTLDVGLNQDAIKEIKKLRKALSAIIAAYDVYLGKGVIPAPKEYSAVVAAIDSARSNLGTNSYPIGLCDSNGNELFVGSIVREPTEINQEVHGDWVEYEIKLQGTVPIMSYFRSQTGQVLPVGYSACCLSDAYDMKMFVFATDVKSLRPDRTLVIQET